MANRSWRWLKARILGLLSAPIGHEPWTGSPLPANRLQAVLMPPRPAESAQSQH